MRRLVDGRGTEWSIDILFASYGTYYLVFSAGAGGEVRKLAIGADSQREAAAALSAMDDSALASALMSISGRMDNVPQEDLRDQAEMNAFFIIPIRSGFIGKIASTHPPTEKRIEKLRELEKQQETA